MHNRSVPTDVMLAHLNYPDVAQADWLVRVFGFEEHYRCGDPMASSDYSNPEALTRPLHLQSPRFAQQPPSIFPRDILPRRVMDILAGRSWRRPQHRSVAVVVGGHRSRDCGSPTSR